jgi:7,8-dihydro-6-hydroxymethylpterin-pyrophosphokinase
MKSRKLVLPHPGILLRDFVLLPLIDLKPELHHPQWRQKTLKSALDELQERFVKESPDDWDFSG